VVFDICYVKLLFLNTITGIYYQIGRWLVIALMRFNLALATILQNQLIQRSRIMNNVIQRQVDLEGVDHV